MIGTDWLLFMGFHAGKYIYRFYLQEFFCQKLNVCQKNIRLGDILTAMTSQYLHHKKTGWSLFTTNLKQICSSKWAHLLQFSKVNMLKIRELPPARKTSTPFLGVSSACLRLSSSSIDVSTVTFPIGPVVSSGMKTRGASSWCDQKGGS